MSWQSRPLLKMFAISRDPCFHVLASIQRPHTSPESDVRLSFRFGCHFKKERKKEIQLYKSFLRILEFSSVFSRGREYRRVDIALLSQTLRWSSATRGLFVRGSFLVLRSTYIFVCVFPLYCRSITINKRKLGSSCTIVFLWILTDFFLHSILFYIHFRYTT